MTSIVDNIYIINLYTFFQIEFKLIDGTHLELRYEYSLFSNDKVKKFIIGDRYLRSRDRKSIIGDNNNNEFYLSTDSTTFILTGNDNFENMMTKIKNFLIDNISYF